MRDPGTPPPNLPLCFRANLTDNSRNQSLEPQVKILGFTVFLNGNLKQSGRGRRRFKNYFVFLIRILRMSLTAPHLNFSITRFTFSEHANFGDYTELFCRDRLRNIQGCKTQALSYSVHSILFLPPRSRHRRRRCFLNFPTLTS